MLEMWRVFEPMKIVKVEYERLFSLGQYENERIALHAEVNPETENVFDCFKDLKATVLSLQKEGLLLDESKKAAESEPTQPTKPEKPTLDEISSFRYEDKESDKGPYKTASKSDNPGNPAFTKLQKYLEEHKGFAVLHGFKFWQFSNNPDVIGRRKK
jgi:hypothetical protein